MPPPRMRRIETPHGSITTPVFMPVGTAGTVKGVTVDELKELGAQIILGNTYHLMLRPGHETIRKLGGLHKFMGWDGPILTDSGGYQVFSLSRLRKITPDGVTFQSHIDGDKHFLTPEKALEIQEALGSDILMVLDDCTPYPVSESEAKKSMELTIEWAKRSAKHFCANGGAVREPPLLFGIIQGSVYKHLRKECAERLLERGGFSGFAIGGISVGEPKDLLYEIAAETAALIPDQFPRYAMGIGLPEDLVELAGYGIDLFDCVVPTRNGRNGELFTPQGSLQIRHAQYKEDPAPIDENCACPVCKKYSRAYLRHLHLAKEILSARLNSIHNLHYFLNLMKDLRTAIEAETYEGFRRDFLGRRITRQKPSPP